MSSIRASMEGELPELAEKLSRLSTIDKAGINNAIAEALRSGTIERFEGEKSPGRGCMEQVHPGHRKKAD